MTENKSYCDICGEQIDLTREFELPKEKSLVKLFI